MVDILSFGYVLSMPSGHFAPHTLALCNLPMHTVYETRRIRLGLLKTKYKTWAALNEALKWERTSARLSQIFNQTERKERGTCYTMGDPTAREIEIALGLPLGFMDTPPSYAELHGLNDPRAKAMELFENLPPEEWATALRLLSALEKPAAKNGTED